MHFTVKEYVMVNTVGYIYVYDGACYTDMRAFQMESD